MKKNIVYFLVYLDFKRKPLLLKIFFKFIYDLYTSVLTNNNLIKNHHKFNTIKFGVTLANVRYTSHLKDKIYYFKS